MKYTEWLLRKKMQTINRIKKEVSFHTNLEDYKLKSTLDYTDRRLDGDASVPDC